MFCNRKKHPTVWCYCLHLVLLEVLGTEPRCVVCMRNVSYRLRHLNVWPLVSGAVWGRLWRLLEHGVLLFERL